MELSYDSFRSEFDIVLKGSMSHRVALGTDARGNITRLDNALSGIPERLERANEQLTNLYNQQEAAKAELVYRFRQAFELLSDYRLIESTASGYQINPKLNVFTDCQLFETKWAVAMKSTDTKEKVEVLKKAIDLYIFFGISTDYMLIGCEIRNFEAAKELDSVINQLVALKMKL